MPGLDITKAELNKMIKDAVQAEIKTNAGTGNKKLMNKEETKTLISDTIAELFKFLWQKSGMWVKQI
jgi:hypothetical protein